MVNLINVPILFLLIFFVSGCARHQSAFDDPSLPEALKPQNQNLMIGPGNPAMPYQALNWRMEDGNGS